MKQDIDFRDLSKQQIFNLVEYGKTKQIRDSAWFEYKKTGSYSPEYWIRFSHTNERTKEAWEFYKEQGLKDWLIIIADSLLNEVTEEAFEYYKRDGGKDWDYIFKNAKSEKIKKYAKDRIVDISELLQYE